MPLANIQLGRADDDDEEWLDVLDAESDEWMRKPQVRRAVGMCWVGPSCCGFSAKRSSVNKGTQAAITGVNHHIRFDLLSAGA